MHGSEAGASSPTPGSKATTGRFDVAVVVVNYNCHAMIDLNLSAASLDAEFAVVVVDNYSGPSERLAIRELAANRRWTLVELPTNRGFGAGVNAGVERARRLGATAFILLNPDAVVDAHVLDELGRQCLADPRVLVSPTIVSSARDVSFIGAEVELAGGRMRRSGSDRTGVALPWLTGACLAFSEGLFDAIGGMAEDYFLYWEDVEFSIRALRCGAMLVVREDLIATHDENGTQGERRGRAKSDLYYYYNCRNRLLFAAQELDRGAVARWMIRTPGAGWEILMRGGRRQLLHSPRPVRAVVAGSLAGLGIAARALISRPLQTVPNGPAEQPDLFDEGSAMEPIRVTVAVLTYLRPQELHKTLSALIGQAEGLEAESAGRYVADVLVIDNDPAGSAAAVVSAHPGVRYRIEPQPGVSAARNRALDSAVSSDLLAFIDDDEMPHLGWLTNLVQTQRRTGAAAVAGRVIEAFDEQPDSWISAGRFFERPSLPTGLEVHAAGAGNLLMDLHQIRQIGLQFDPRFGLSGGEDTLFTRTLRLHGRTIVWCNEAAVTDRVPKTRATRAWVLARAWSHGNTDSVIELTLAGDALSRSGARAHAVARGTARIVAGGLRFAWGRASRNERHHARGLRAVWRGAGMIAGALGLVYQEYARQSSRLVVMESFPQSPPRGNPFRVLLANSLMDTAGLDVRFFNWRAALLSSYDVFHVHWPEVLLSGRDPLRRIVRQALFLALLARLRLTRTPIVKTVHNLELPQGLSRREIALLRAAERQTAFRIRINTSTVLPDDRAAATIPHGHYRDWFDTSAMPDAIPGRLLFFGLVRRYKGVDTLITAFRQISSDEIGLCIVGQPSTAELAARLESLAAGDQRIELLLRFVTDDEVVRQVGSAALVVLPYREMHNSAGVLTALSLGRPVLVPDNEVNRRLGKEVGPGWVHTYEGTLTADHLTDALQAISDRLPAAPPDLSAREWERVGRDHEEAFRRATEMATSSWRRRLQRNRRV